MGDDAGAGAGAGAGTGAAGEGEGTGAGQKTGKRRPRQRRRPPTAGNVTAAGITQVDGGAGADPQPDIDTRDIQDTHHTHEQHTEGQQDGEGEGQLVEAEAEAAPADTDPVNISKLLNFDLRMAMEVFSFGGKGAKAAAAAAAGAGAAAAGAGAGAAPAAGRNFQFWSTQPVPRMDEKIEKSEPIEAEKRIEDIRPEPYSLPDGFRWDTLDLERPEELRELYTLLNENYVEDDDCMFRFDYQAAFLQWAMRPPGWRRCWHCGVRVVKSGRLVGFISAVPADLRIYRQPRKVVEINFLCVHKKLRSKRVAPVLIREITRRVNLTGVFQGVYTAGKVLPKPIATCRYWHRSLNPRKLIEIEFSRLTRNMTMQRTLKLYRLPDAPKTPGFRKMEPQDCRQAVRLLAEYLKRFDLAPVYSEEEFRHWFVPRPGIVESYVVATPEGKVTDFVSYYSLPSTVINHPTHKTLKAAYSFYNVSTVTPWTELMTDALISAKNSGFDVFNALDLMDNQEFLSPLKFGIGDGNLQYYLYNWRCPHMPPGKVGLVLQ